MFTIKKVIMQRTRNAKKITSTLKNRRRDQVIGISLLCNSNIFVCICGGVASRYLLGHQNCKSDFLHHRIVTRYIRHVIHLRIKKNARNTFYWLSSKFNLCIRKGLLSRMMKKIYIITYLMTNKFVINVRATCLCSHKLFMFSVKSFERRT